MDDISKTILDDAFVGFWDWNLVTYTVRLSAAFKAMFGYAEDELENTISDWQKLVLPDDLITVSANFVAHIQSRGKTPIKNEVRYRHKNGSVIWVRCTGRITEWDESGRPLRIQGVNIDITAQKAAEEKLKSMTARHTHLGNDARIGEWEFDMITGELYWSPVVKQIYGVADDFKPVFNLKSRKGIAFTNDDASREKLNNAIKHAINTGQSYNLELRIATATGAERFARIIGHADFDNGICKKMYGTLQEIEDPKTILEELEITEQQFRSAFENSTIGMALVSPEGKMFKVNRVLCDILGYGPEILMTKDFQEITYPDDLEKDVALVTKVLADEIDTYQLEKRYVHKNGELIWANLSVSLVRDNMGRPLHFISQIENITQRRSAEIKLRESEAKYRKIFENVQDVFYQTDYNGIVTEISPSIEHYSGYRREDVIGTNVENFYYHPHDRARLLELLKSHGKVNDYQVRLKTNNNELIYISVNTHVLTNDEGHAIGFEGSMRDIRERKKAEYALKERDALFTKLSEQIPGAIFQFRFSPGGRSGFPFVSKGMIDLIELDQDEIKTDAMPVFKRIHRDDMIEVYKSLTASYNDLDKWEREFRVNVPGKQAMWVQAVARPETMPDKSVMWYGYIADVTEKKVKEQQLKSTFELVTEQNNRLLNFAYIISHNLRAHSGNFAVLVDLISDTTNEAEKAEMMKLLKIASSNLSETIMHLNDVVTIQTSINQQRAPLNLHSYIEKTIAILKINYSRQQAIININIAHDLEIEYNAAYLESILFNFLSNSIKYGKPGRQTIINVDYYLDNGRRVLQIADNGLGIDLKRHRDKLFGMYKTFHDNKDAKGIGLFITKNQVDAMGGKIEVSSEVGKGTTFKVYLS